jgi:hypothetical protein
VNIQLQLDITTENFQLQLVNTRMDFQLQLDITIRKLQLQLDKTTMSLQLQLGDSTRIFQLQLEILTTKPTKILTNHVRVHAALSHEHDCYNSFTLYRRCTHSP